MFEGTRFVYYTLKARSGVLLRGSPKVGLERGF
jgi:hypothetical protein